MLRLFPLLSILWLFQSCQKESIDDCDTLEPLYSLTNFRVGVAVSVNELNTNETYTELVKQQFNSITPGNAFKMDALSPQQGIYDFAIADSLIAFAKANNKTVHGHTLIWHSQLPGWAYEFDGDKEDWIALLELQVATVVSHFGKEVKSWDVVNEAFEDDGSFRESIWFENIGEEYIKRAFEAANKANPNALLFYNDYNLLAKPKKCKAVLKHLNKLKKGGVKIDGVGCQSHIFYNYPNNYKIEDALNSIADANFLVHLSEVDISLNRDGNMVLSENKLERQAEKMQSLVTAFLKLPKGQQFGISFWGVSDLDSWIPPFFGREDYPLLFDNNYNAKPMYCGFKAGMQP